MPGIPEDLRKTADAARQVAATLNTLPLDHLFGAPFDAAYQAQSELALSTAFFMKRFGMNENNELLEFTASSSFDIAAANLTDASGDPVQFIWNKARESNGAASTTKQYSLNPPGKGDNPGNVPSDATLSNYLYSGYEGTLDISGVQVHIDNSGRVVGSQGSRALTLPLISLLNIPALSITEVNVDFIIEIKTQQSSETDIALDKQEQQIQTDMGWSGNWFRSGWWASSRVVSTASVSQKQKVTDETSTACTYQVHMSAIDTQPVGMKMLLDFLTANTDNVASSQLADDGYSIVPTLGNDGFYKFGTQAYTQNTKNIRNMTS